MCKNKSVSSFLMHTFWRYKIYQKMCKNEPVSSFLMHTFWRKQGAKKIY